MYNSGYYLLHNPRCSKSRAALCLLQERNIQAEVIEYLKQPLTLAQLQQIQHALNLPASAMLRDNQDEFKQLNLALNTLNDDDILKLIERTPILLQRPIFIAQGQAIIARPCTQLLSLIENH